MRVLCTSRLVVVMALAAVVSACGASPQGGPEVAIPVDGASGQPAAPATSERFACDAASAGVDPMPDPAPDPSADQEPPTAGQMTEEAAQGKRLFDAERWAESAMILRRVLAGETGDDMGNRQIAEYHLAICHYRLKHYQDSLAAFSAIAGRVNHLKFQETLLWLAKLATLGPPYTKPAIRLVATRYFLSNVQRLNNPQQRALFWQLQHLVGREWYRAGQYDKAVAALENVPAESEYHELAKECLDLARQHAVLGGAQGR